MSDDIIKRLREAIAAGPTPGPWFHAYDFGQIGSVENEAGHVIVQAQQTVPGREDIDRRNKTAAYIAAASPDNIAALLDDLDFLRRTEEAQYESLMNTWKVLERFNAHPGRTDDPLHDCVEVALKARDDNIAALLDRLDAAEAENERLRMELAHEEQRVADMMADVNRVGHENEALREDAERYRWLVDDHQDSYQRNRQLEILDRLAVMTHSSASAAIDAARSEK